MINPHTGQVLTPGTPEYDAFMKGAAPELNALGVATSDYLKGGVGAQLMNNPLTSAYSTAFAQNNTTPGGGQAFAQSNGGIIGYGKNNGYVDASGNSTGLGSALSGGLNPNFAAQIKGNTNYASGNQPGVNSKPIMGDGSLARVSPEDAAISQRIKAIAGQYPVDQLWDQNGNPVPGRSPLQPSQDYFGQMYPYGNSQSLGMSYGQPRYQQQNRQQYQPQYMNQPAQYGQQQYMGQSAQYWQPRYQQSQMMPYYRQNIGNNMGFPQTTANSTSSQFSGLNGRGLL